MFSPARLIPYALATLALGLVAPATATASAEGFYSPAKTFVPRDGQGEGTVSAYGGATPRFDKDAPGGEFIHIPATGKNEANLLWTFWRHKRPAAEAWPVDEGARAGLTIRSESDVTIRTRIFVRGGDWSEPVDGPALALVAGRPADLELPLPAAIPPGAIESVRVVFSASPSVPALDVSAFSIGRRVAVAVYPEKHDHARPSTPVTVAGRASPGASVVVRAQGPDGANLREWRAVGGAADGRFSFQADPASLPAGPLVLRAAVRPASGGDTVWSEPAELYLYPILRDGAALPMVRREGRNLLVDGKPWAFLGLNYTRFLLEFSLPGRVDHRTVAEEMRKYGSWGLTVLRVPLHLGMFQPREGVFPDHPDYLPALRAHNVDARFFDLFEYTVAVAGHHGIRLVLDWHEMPTDPYRYFVGGNLTEKQAGQPGKGIAWLSDPFGKNPAKPGDVRHTRAIAETNRWLARRFKGNGNILGFEAPYNEPHSVTDSADFAWRRITADTVLPIVTEDPARLTFGMPPAWGHSNVLNSVTWMLPDHLTGMAPHHYLGNGPVPTRADAKSRKEPWLARDHAATFGHAFFAAALPHSAAPYPVWNGESGEHGHASLFPELDQRTASSYMIEAQLLQAYAAGWTGSLGWTLTGNPTVYRPVEDLYEREYRRFAPVFSAGPVDLDRAQLLFVQNPAAVPVANGLNHALVPFARLALDLHLAPVHYMSDDQLLATGLVQMAVGLEQVEQIASGLRYKAAVVDTRNLDSRALELLRGAKLPLLVIDDAARLTPAQLSAFLKKSGFTLDERTPAELQLIEGPAHFLVYRRAGDGPARAHPRLGVEGPFRLIDEQGRVAFSGTAAALAEQGLAIDLPKWRTAIFRIEKNASR